MPLNKLGKIFGKISNQSSKFTNYTFPYVMIEMIEAI